MMGLGPGLGTLKPTPMCGVPRGRTLRYAESEMSSTDSRHGKWAPPDPTVKKCPECLSAVPIAARGCPFGAQPIEMVAAGRAV